MQNRLSKLFALALCLTVFGTLGWGQSSIPSTQAAPSKAPEKAVPVPGKKIPDEVTFYFFIRSLSDDHVRIQKKIATAKPGDPPILEGENYRQEMGISPSEYQLILDSVLVTRSNLTEIERQYMKEKDAWLRANGGTAKGAPVDPELRRLGVEHDETIHRMIANLKIGLGDADYVKFDAFVRRHWGGGQVYAVHHSASKAGGE